MDALHPRTSSFVAATLDTPEIPGTLDQQPPGGIGDFIPNDDDIATMALHIKGAIACTYLAAELANDPSRDLELASVLATKREHQVIIDEISARTAERAGIPLQSRPQAPRVVYGQALIDALKRSVTVLSAATLAPTTPSPRRAQARRVRSSRRVSRVAARSLSDSSDSEPPAPSHPARPRCQAQGREHDGSTTSSNPLTAGFVRLGCGTLAERGSAVLPSQATEMGGAR